MKDKCRLNVSLYLQISIFSSVTITENYENQIKTVYVYLIKSNSLILTVFSSEYKLTVLNTVN